MTSPTRMMLARLAVPLEPAVDAGADQAAERADRGEQAEADRAQAEPSRA